MDDTEDIISQIRIIALVEQLNRWNYYYYHKRYPLINDQCYDEHKRMLIDLEHQYPQYVLPQSPTQH